MSTPAPLFPTLLDALAKHLQGAMQPAPDRVEVERASTLEPAIKRLISIGEKVVVVCPGKYSLSEIKGTTGKRRIAWPRYNFTVYVSADELVGLTEPIKKSQDDVLVMLEAAVSAMYGQCIFEDRWQIWAYEATPLDVSEWGPGRSAYLINATAISLNDPLTS